MHRFFKQQKLEKDMTVNIDGEDFLHLKNSLRIKAGESIEISDGFMNTYIATICVLKKDSCDALVNEKIENSNEPDCKITLYPALLKGDRFENMIQKCIEGGVYSINPVITSNTIVEIANKNKDRKVDRWLRVSKLACMQCKRDILVNIEEPMKLTDAVQKLMNDKNKLYKSFVCYEAEKKDSIKKLLDKAVKESIRNINIFIGPEGGFSEKEISYLTENGIHPVHMGRRILRADTAAYSAVFYTAMRYEL